MVKLMLCEIAEFRGAHASSVLLRAPRPQVLGAKVRFGGGAETSTRGACAPRIRSGARYTRERRRPELRVYFTGRRFGSILEMPVPSFTSMI